MGETKKKLICCAAFDNNPLLHTCSLIILALFLLSDRSKIQSVRQKGKYDCDVHTDVSLGTAARAKSLPTLL